MENNQEKRNYSGYRPKKSNILKLEAYISRPKQKTVAMVSSKASKVLKNKKF